jgi:predicted outer membrane repeat protein
MSYFKLKLYGALIIFSAAAILNAKHFHPKTVSDLIAAINEANGNDRDDIINLGGQTFILTAPNNSVEGSNGLPDILGDNSHTLTFSHGMITRLVGSAPFRLMHASPGSSLRLVKVTLSNGNASSLVTNGSIGGAVLVEGEARFDLCTFTGNTAANGGAVAAINRAFIEKILFSTFSNNTASASGGGLYVSDSTVAYIIDSTFSNNAANGTTASSGGAIANDHSLIVYIINSTFSANSTAGNGGAISNGTTVGTTNDAGVISWLINSTIVNNTAAVSGGGVYNQAPSTGVTPGGIITNIISTIIALNAAPTGPDFFGDVVNESFNLIGKNDGSNFVAGTPNANLSFVGTTATPINPMIAPLANNGGPTQTHALITGSIAIDHGANPNNLRHDQRGKGFKRTVGAGTDIGAFEVQAQ